MREKGSGIFGQGSLILFFLAWWIMHGQVKTFPMYFLTVKCRQIYVGCHANLSSWPDAEGEKDILSLSFFHRKDSHKDCFQLQGYKSARPFRIIFTKTLNNLCKLSCACISCRLVSIVYVAL